MLVIKFSGKDAELVKAAATALKDAAREENRHKKAREGAKETLSRLIAQKRDLVIDTLPAKSIVVVQCDGEDAVKIERKASQRFDQVSFGLLHRDLVDEFTRETPATYFDSLM